MFFQLVQFRICVGGNWVVFSEARVSGRASISMLVCLVLDGSPCIRAVSSLGIAWTRLVFLANLFVCVAGHSTLRACVDSACFSCSVSLLHLSLFGLEAAGAE